MPRGDADVDGERRRPFVELPPIDQLDDIHTNVSVFNKTTHHCRTRRGRLAIFKNIESPVHGRSRPFEPPTKIEIAGR